LKVITLPQQVCSAIEEQPPHAALSPPPAAQAVTELGDIATAHFKRFTTKTKDADTTFGTHDRGGEFYIGDKEIKIDGDDIIVGDKVCGGMPGL
jgi:hypothetical protein